MALTYDIDHDQRFVHVQTEGLVVLDDILVYYEALVVQNAMPYPKLFDASRIDLRLSDEDLMNLAAWVSAFAVHDPRGPIAIIATTDETKDMMRRYMNLGDAKRPVKLFTSEEAGRKWLATQVPA